MDRGRWGGDAGWAPRETGPPGSEGSWRAGPRTGQPGQCRCCFPATRKRPEDKATGSASAASDLYNRRGGATSLPASPPSLQPQLTAPVRGQQLRPSAASAGGRPGWAGAGGGGADLQPRTDPRSGPGGPPAFQGQFSNHRLSTLRNPELSLQPRLQGSVSSAWENGGCCRSWSKPPQTE